MYHRLCGVVSIMSNRVCSSVVPLKYRNGSPKSYVSAAVRGPKLTSLLDDGKDVHASKQLPGIRPVPSLSLQLIRQSLGRGGTPSIGLEGPDTVEVLNTEVYMLFTVCDGSLDRGYDIDVSGSLIGNAMVPSRSRAKALDELDKIESSAGSSGPLGNTRLVVEFDFAGTMG